MQGECAKALVTSPVRFVCPPLVPMSKYIERPGLYGTFNGNEDGARITLVSFNHGDLGPGYWHWMAGLGTRAGVNLWVLSDAQNVVRGKPKLVQRAWMDGREVKVWRFPPHPAGGQFGGHDVAITRAGSLFAVGSVHGESAVASARMAVALSKKATSSSVASLVVSDTNRPRDLSAIRLPAEDIVVPAEYDPLAAHCVRGGRERKMRESGQPRLPQARFSNLLSRESLRRLRRVVRVASSLAQPLTSGELIARADASSDQKGAMGALYMLDVEHVVHFQPGPRRQLVWHSGAFSGERGERATRQLFRYEVLREILVAASETWIATDYLLRTATFDPELWSSPPDDGANPSPGTWDLPVNFFVDNGKSARKYLLGALKALYWRELVAWRMHSSQAVTWRWIGPRGKCRPLDNIVRFDPQLPSDDPYLTNRPLSRRERLDLQARERMWEYERQFQSWIDERFPEAAQRYKDAQRARQLENEKRRREELREAAKWLG